MINPRQNTESYNSHQWAKRRDIVLTILGWIIIACVALAVFYYLRLPLILFMIALFLAYALAPSVRLLEKFIDRSVAIVIVYLVVLIGFGVLIYFSVNTAVQQFAMLDSTLHVLLTPKDHNISPFMRSLQKLGISQAQIENATDQLTGEAEKLISSIVPFLSSLFTSILDLVVISIMSIYLLIDGPRVKDGCRRICRHHTKNRHILLLPHFKELSPVIFVDKYSWLLLLEFLSDLEWLCFMFRTLYCWEF